MDYQTITQLVEKYFQGRTDLAEEAHLRAYFQQERIDPDLEVYRPLFAFLQSAKASELPADFAPKVFRKVAVTDAAPVRRLWPTLAKIAAVLLIALASWWYFNPAPPPQTAAVDWSKYEPKTVAEAYEITRSVLLKTSKELNQSANRAAEEISKVKEASKIFK